MDDDAVDARVQRRRRVHPELTYVRARYDGGRIAIVARELVAKVLGEDAEVLERFPGAELVGTAYEPPFGFIGAEAYGPKGHTVLPADFVTAADGTGLVHTAIAFGEDDFRLGEQEGLTVVNPVRLDGTYDERIGPYAGRWVKDADPDLIEDLRGRDRLLRSEQYEHSYPHCWRCNTPLLYYAKPSWYIATSQIKDRLLASNEGVNWHPEHVKHGRFGNWLEGNVDWALSRERYWGTPLPVWRCAHGCTKVMGSLAELERESGVKLDDPHRPYVDDVVLTCDNCGGDMHRVPEVIDVWFDSGSMPFAQFHAPHANLDHFEERFPADFICEALDQTRGWFYSLLAISTLLFDTSSYRNVVCLGLILDEEGHKMSKSLGNTVEPWEVIDRYGADALRWYFFTSKQPWDGYRFSLETIGEAVRQFMLQLWNTYGVLRAVRQRQRRHAERGPARRPPAISTAGRSAACRRRWRSSATGSTTSTPPRPGAPSRSSWSRAVQLVRAPLTPALLGRRSGGVRDAAPLPGDRRPAAGSVLPLPRRRDLRQPRRRRAERASVRLPRRRRPRCRARAGDGRGARDGPPRAGRSCPGQDQDPPAAAGGGGGGHRPRARGHRAARPHRARGAQRARAAASSPKPTSSGRSRSSPTTGPSAPASARRCRWWPRRSRAWTRAMSRRRCARGAAW